MSIAEQSETIIQPDFSAIKFKQQAIWASGNYAIVGCTVQITGENLCEAMNLHSGESVLDVAAGNGNASLAAARRFCHVVSTDYVPALLEKAELRASADGLAIDFQTADAEKLPFDNESFDNVISTFGVMFAPNQKCCTQELVRVCRSGGKIGMANWTPTSFIGQLFKIIGKYVTPPLGVASPANWGNEAFIQEHFAGEASEIEITRKSFMFRYLSADHWVDIFRTYYGPVLKVFEMLNKEQRSALTKEIMELINNHNESGDDTMVVRSEYLEIVIVKK